MRFQILFDSLQEGRWFQSLDSRLSSARLDAMTGAPRENKKLATVLAYDRPDVVLLIDDVPVLVIERSEEVPSGHNVGQRFARLVAAAQAGAICLYKFPFVAKKHGGETAGPRFVNLRLFEAMKRVEQMYQTPLVPICWPVDDDYEVAKGTAKDVETKELVSHAIDLWSDHGSSAIQRFARSNKVAAAQLAASEFAATKVTRRADYDAPPESVELLKTAEIGKRFGIIKLPHQDDSVLYKIGMKYVRSDPYTGMAMLYDYLYARISATKRLRAMVLHCPEISIADWRLEAKKGKRNKSVRLYAEVADMMIFKDGHLPRILLVP